MTTTEKPKIYVTNTPYGLETGTVWNYMSERNKRVLSEFSIPIFNEKTTPSDEDELIERLTGVRAILQPNGCENITKRVLEAVGTIEAIVLAHSAWPGGLWKTAAELGIKTVEGSNAVDLAVAEWTVAAAIMGRRNLIAACVSLKDEGLWQKDWRKASLLLGSTVGLVGLGRIGRIVARYFQTLGTELIAYDKYFDKERAAQMGIKLVGLDELLSTADVVSLHLPVTKETKGILGKREFSQIKDGAVFVNSARAELCDTSAMIDEFKKQRFSAYMDVYPDEGEMYIRQDLAQRINMDHPFYKAVHQLENVYMSSHIAGTNDAMYERAGADAIETLRLYFEGKGLRDMRDLN